MGIFRAVEREPYATRLTAQLAEARTQVTNRDLDALLQSGHTWTVA
jgi:hypothetical protein